LRPGSRHLDSQSDDQAGASQPNHTQPPDEAGARTALPWPAEARPLLRRREFVKATALAAGAAVITSAAPSLAAGSRARTAWMDVNINLSRWPLRRLALDETPALVTSLSKQGVTQAWAGNFEGLLHKDLGAVNAQLANDCRRHGRGLLLPFGSINPAAPDWEEELRRCANRHRMPGIRLHPNYHGYALDTPAFARLLRLATDLGLIVQLALVMEDERMMHPRLRVAPVDPAPLAGIVQQTPGLRLVLLNALTALRGKRLAELLKAGEIYVEIAMLEGVAGIEMLLHDIPVQRLLFGSFAPLFYFEAAKLKLKESVVEPGNLELIRAGNAQRLLAARPPKE
jgi:predicted TIM-barrel fold metal-dependent hydrolase